MSTKTFIVEEHNEAFIVWSHALKNDLLRRNSCLFHFDDHSDFRTPTFDTSVHGLIHKPLDEIKTFVYREMKIDTFIAPAMYLELFDEFIWIKNGMRNAPAANLHIRSYNDEGKRLVMAKEQGGAEDLISFKYAKLSPSGFGEFEADPLKAAVLDIDLDYFSCCEAPALSNTVVIEITQSEYEEFVSNKYHYLNFITAGFIKAVQENGSYFYVLNGYREMYMSGREMSEDVISSRIDELIADLKAKDLAPDLITICRSRFSGFTPGHQWETIENQLLDGLSALYQLDVKHLSDLEI